MVAHPRHLDFDNVSSEVGHDLGTQAAGEKPAQVDDQTTRLGEGVHDR